MLVVSDTSPIIVLLNIGHIDVLQRLFAEIVLPPAVAEELTNPRRAPLVRAFMASPPAWVLTKAPREIESIPGLHRGETEAISLAQELKADLLLIDERRAYRAAVARHLPAIGTVRVLERAAEEGLIDLADAFNSLKRRSDFWIDHALLDVCLESHRKRQAAGDAQAYPTPERPNEETE